jgi:hypothetical protein
MKGCGREEYPCLTLQEITLNHLSDQNSHEIIISEEFHIDSCFSFNSFNFKVKSNKKPLTDSVLFVYY